MYPVCTHCLLLKENAIGGFASQVQQAVKSIKCGYNRIANKQETDGAVQMSSQLSQLDGSVSFFWMVATSMAWARPL